MFTKKAISCGVVALQMVTSTFGITSTRAEDRSVTPEETLLAQVYQIQGTAMNTQEAQAQIILAAQDYLDTASDEGREERLNQALLEMNIASPTEIQSFVSDFSVSSSAIASEHFTSNQEAMNKMKSDLQKVFANHPAVGAQFSACGAVLPAFYVAMVAIFVIGATRHPNTSTLADTLMAIGAGGAMVGFPIPLEVGGWLGCW